VTINVCGILEDFITEEIVKSAILSQASKTLSRSAVHILHDACSPSKGTPKVSNGAFAKIPDAADGNPLAAAIPQWG